jgi:hypothetical protein
MSEFVILSKQELLQKLASMKPGQEGFCLPLSEEQSLFTLNITERTLDGFLEEIRQTFKICQEAPNLEPVFVHREELPWYGGIWLRSNAD